MNKLILRVCVWTLIAAFLGGAWVYSFVAQHMDEPVNLPALNQERVVWSIPKGSNLRQVNKLLAVEKIISNAKVMSAYATLFSKTEIQAGDYWITEEDTARSLLLKFNSGDVVRRSITFPEGWSFKQWLTHLSNIDQFQFSGTVGSEQLLEMAGMEVANPEGWLFPDTYSYTSTDTVVDILKQAHFKMQNTLSTQWKTRQPNLPYDTPYEALIMASIVEKETGLVSERGQIAGVFVRRLRKGMRLQTDPTVIYGMGDEYRGNIRRSDLKAFSPYNTYRVNGLPPTPIAMPSADAIRAALHPEDGSSLYFVARGDGGHHFSNTLEEHNKAVQKYQIDYRKRDYQSSPQ
ncbi:endolytic transglycosylase MltG [Gammaproteobacteria bacterium]|nr:endolytic transglycosylase MltG [Gammaproteobacteria bacterium]|tara:strand:- start:3859 stop:4899 length:1041 start_codon:yes stop_codon:yes gene_type:complete